MDRHFGNYILHERVGIGGMGEVFRATKQGPDGFEVQVALKVILPHLAREKPFKDRFTREATLAASLKHPNIVNVHGFDIVDETSFIEMEYVPGADLRRILRSLPSGERLSIEESTAVLYAVARGLTHAHQHQGSGNGNGGIIHCDLNPHNILISTLGEVKVTDFGIARAMQGGASASATVRGKLAYMSPEQMAGSKLDRRTDLFSLGIIAYQLLSGNHPFERRSEGATIAAIGKAEYHPLSEAAPDLPPALHELVDQLLSLDPASRPGSAAHVLEILEPMVLPSAAASLASRVVSVTAESSGASGVFKNDSPTAPTLARSRVSHIWPYLLVGAIFALLVAAVFLLPTKIIPKSDKKADVIPAETIQAVHLPSEPEAPPRQQTLNLVSNPPGAIILADGTPIGDTPLSIRRDKNVLAQRFEAALYGYRSESFQIPPDAVDRFVVTLAPLPTGSVRISARPWARVSFRGESLGETPVIISGVPVGRHNFILTYEPLGVQKEVTREIREGMNTVSVEMREE